MGKRFDVSDPWLSMDTHEAGLLDALHIVQAEIEMYGDGFERESLLQVIEKIATRIMNVQAERLKEIARSAGRARRITSADPDLVERLLGALSEEGISEFSLSLRGDHNIEVFVVHGRDIGALDMVVKKIGK